MIEWFRKLLVIVMVACLFLPMVNGLEYTVWEDVEEGVTLSNSQRKLARTSDGVLHLVGFKSNGTRLHIYHAWSLDNGTTWNMEQVSDPPDNYNQYYPSIAVDSMDNIHVVWYGYGWGYTGGATSILYREKTSQGWQPTVSITDLEGDNYKPVIAVDSRDNLHVAWYGYDYGNNTGYYNIQYKSRIGTSWQTKISLTDTNMEQYNPAIAVDTCDNIHLVWGSAEFIGTPEYSISYRQKTGGGWHPQETITYSPDFQAYPTLTVDQQDRVHVVWEGADGSDNTNIKYRVKTITGWSLEENITQSDKYQSYPSISVDSEDNLHLVWEGLGWGSNPSKYNLQYKRKTSQGWEPQISLTDSPTHHMHPSMLWAMWPDPPLTRTDVPETGYALAYVSQTPQGKYDLLYLPSMDLTWGNKEIIVMVGGELTGGSTINPGLTWSILMALLALTYYYGKKGEIL